MVLASAGNPGPPVGLVLPVRHDAEGLAEIFLMDALHRPAARRGAVIAVDDEDVPPDHLQLDSRNPEAYSGREPHAEELVRREAGKGR
jgi:hypothetical protein